TNSGLDRLEERIGSTIEVALADEFTANGDRVGHGQFNTGTELVDADVGSTGVVGAETADGIDENRIGHDSTSAQVGEEFAAVGGSVVPEEVTGDFSADQDGIDGDEVHADSGTKNTRGGASRKG